MTVRVSEGMLTTDRHQLGQQHGAIHTALASNNIPININIISIISSSSSSYRVDNNDIIAGGQPATDYGSMQRTAAPAAAALFTSQHHQPRHTPIRNLVAGRHSKQSTQPNVTAKMSQRCAISQLHPSVFCSSVNAVHGNGMHSRCPMQAILISITFTF